MKKIVPVNKIPFADEEDELKKELLTKEIRRMLSGEFDEGMKRRQARQSDRGMAREAEGPDRENIDKILGDRQFSRYIPTKPGYEPEHDVLNRESRISPAEEKYLQHLERIQDLQSPVSRIPNLEDYNPVSGKFESDILVKPKSKKFLKLRDALGKKSFFNADTEDYEFEK